MGILIYSLLIIAGTAGFVSSTVAFLGVADFMSIQSQPLYRSAKK